MADSLMKSRAEGEMSTGPSLCTRRTFPRNHFADDLPRNRASTLAPSRSLRPRFGLRMRLRVGCCRIIHAILKVNSVGLLVFYLL